MDRNSKERKLLGDILDNTRLPFNADEVQVTYDGDNPTVVVYKKQNITVMTVNISYDGSNPTNIEYIES